MDFLDEFLDVGLPLNAELVNVLCFLVAQLELDNSAFRRPLTPELAVYKELLSELSQLLKGFQYFLFFLFVLFQVPFPDHINRLLNFLMFLIFFISFMFLPWLSGDFLGNEVFADFLALCLYELYFFPYFFHVINDLDRPDFQRNRLVLFQALPLLLQMVQDVGLRVFPCRQIFNEQTVIGGTVQQIVDPPLRFPSDRSDQSNHDRPENADNEAQY